MYKTNALSFVPKLLDFQCVIPFAEFRVCCTATNVFENFLFQILINQMQTPFERYQVALSAKYR